MATATPNVAKCEIEDVAHQHETDGRHPMRRQELPYGWLWQSGSDQRDLGGERQMGLEKLLRLLVLAVLHEEGRQLLEVRRLLVEAKFVG